MAGGEEKKTAEVPRVQDGWTVGRLVAHGRANYHWDPEESMSYYIRLETRETEEGARQRREHADQNARPIDGREQRRAPQAQAGGIRELWGWDLGRAIRESRSGVEIGKTVAAKIVSREPLISDTPSTKPKRGRTGYWNRWEVETVQFVAQRNRFARAVNENYRNARQDGVVGKEALALYLIHEGARRLATARYSHPEDQKAFINSVKNFLEVSPERKALVARAVEKLNRLKSTQSSAATQSREADSPDHDRNREPLQHDR